MTDAPTIDLEDRRVLLSRRHLAVLAGLATDGPPSPDREARDALAAAGALDADGEAIPALRPVAAAAASAKAIARVSRLRGDVHREVEVRCGPDGVLVVPAADGVSAEVILAAPTAMARTLLRLAHVGPRDRPSADVLELSADALLAGVRGPASWRDELGLTDAVLTRLELRTHPEQPGPVVTLLDTPEATWRVEGDGARARLAPFTPTSLLDVLAAWQLAVIGPDSPADVDDAARDQPASEPPVVELHDGGRRCRLPVPADWEHLTDAPALPFCAREVAEQGFATTVTAVVDDAPIPSDPREGAASVARDLDGGVVIAADADERGHVYVLAHGGPTHDVVSVQRRTAGVAVTYTAGMTAWPRLGPWLRQLADTVGGDGAASPRPDADGQRDGGSDGGEHR